MKIIKPYFVIEHFPSGMLKRIEKAGRTCYKSESKITDDSAKKFVKMIIEKGHESVLEHESATVRIICDRGVSHEIVRHRLVSYSQESTRYCNYGEKGEVTFIQPCFWSKNTSIRDLWLRSVVSAGYTYLDLLRVGVSPQEARSVLPNSLKTEIVVTANLREWRHIFRLRTSSKAHPQMREIMIPLLKEFQKRLPVVFDDIFVKE